MTMPTPTFLTWLARQAKREDTVGQIAHVLRGQRGLKSFQALHQILDVAYAGDRFGRGDAGSWLNRAWVEWRQELNGQKPLVVNDASAELLEVIKARHARARAGSRRRSPLSPKRKR